MDLDSVAFPALIIADDGWVDYLVQRDDLAFWTRSAINNYSKRKVILYDSHNHAWRVNAIEPNKPSNFVTKILAETLWNPRVLVRLSLELIAESSAASVRQALYTAIDVDDDILTQEATADEVRTAIQNASTFQEFVTALNKTHSILV